MVLIFALTLPAIIFPQNKAVVEATGEYQVLTQTYFTSREFAVP